MAKCLRCGADASWLQGRVPDEVALDASAEAPKKWPIKGVRVDGDKVVISVRGGNDVARWLCGEVLSMHKSHHLDA